MKIFYELAIGAALFFALTGQAYAIDAMCASNAKCTFIDSCLKNPYNAMSKAGMRPDKKKTEAFSEDEKVEVCNAAWHNKQIIAETERMKKQTAVMQRAIRCQRDYANASREEMNRCMEK